MKDVYKEVIITSLQTSSMIGMIGKKICYDKSY